MRRVRVELHKKEITREKGEESERDRDRASIA